MSEYSAGHTITQPCGKQNDQILGPFFLGSLRDCLQKQGFRTRFDPIGRSSTDDGLPYLSCQATFWEGVTFAGRRFDSAQWNAPILRSTDAAQIGTLEYCQTGTYGSKAGQILPASK